MNSLVVFDLDGTLIDSRRDLADSTNQMLESFGRPALDVEAVAGMVGEGARLLVARALAASALDVPVDEALDRFRAIYDRRLLQHTRLYAGVAEAVAAAAARSSLAVLTNKPERPSRRLVEAFGLDAMFQWILGGDSRFPRKPDPAGMLHLVDAARVTIDRTLLIGDSFIDVETGRRAGVKVCGAAYGFGAGPDGRGLAGAAWVVRTPGDIIPVLDQWFDH